MVPERALWLSSLPPISTTSLGQVPKVGWVWKVPTGCPAPCRALTSSSAPLGRCRPGLESTVWEVTALETEAPGDSMTHCRPHSPG